MFPDNFNASDLIRAQQHIIILQYLIDSIHITLIVCHTYIDLQVCMGLKNVSKQVRWKSIWKINTFILHIAMIGGQWCGWFKGCVAILVGWLYLDPAPAGNYIILNALPKQLVLKAIPKCCLVPCINIRPRGWGIHRMAENVVSWISRTYYSSWMYLFINGTISPWARLSGPSFTNMY